MRDFLADHELDGAIVWLRDSGFVTLIGETHGDIARSWFNLPPDPGEAARVYALVDSQRQTDPRLVPSMVSQGDFHCALCIPEDGVLVALFHRSTATVIDLAQRTRELGDAVDVYWQTARPDVDQFKETGAGR